MRTGHSVFISRLCNKDLNCLSFYLRCKTFLILGIFFISAILFSCGIFFSPEIQTSFLIVSKNILPDYFFPLCLE